MSGAQGQTLEPVLVDVTDGGHCKAEPRLRGTLQHHAGGLLEGSVLVHKDVHCPTLVLHAVEVERGADDQVIPTAGKYPEIDLKGDPEKPLLQ